MPVIMVGKDDARVRTVHKASGHITMQRWYFGKHSANAALFTADAHCTSAHHRVVRPHFHEADQFQILLGAPGGRFGTHPIKAFAVHYVDAYRPYGPIIGEDEPVWFFTMRAERSDVTAYMPEERAKLPYHGYRSHVAEFDRLTEADLPAPGAVQVQIIIETDIDGLGAAAMTGGPHATIALPDTAATGGQFVYVAEGSVRCSGEDHREDQGEDRGEDYGPEALGWQEPDEEGCTMVAGERGARLFVLRFPTPSTAAQRQPVTVGT